MAHHHGRHSNNCKRLGTNAEPFIFVQVDADAALQEKRHECSK